tara:strand:- start:2097 stop:3002 length:906 start_codon:yes stop_codon:yes gene_type:complete
MKKYNLKNIAGLSLVEMLIGIVITSMMILAIITSYNVVNKSYSQVTDRAKISRAGRDIVEMMMRDIRMAGFRYILGTNTLGIPTRSYLEFKGGDTTILESHDPIIIEKNVLGFSVDGTAPPTIKHNADDICCDRIHIVYDDFNQNDVNQPYKRYKITYFALPVDEGNDQRYAVYKTVQSWIQVVGDDTGAWSTDCAVCYVEQKIRDHVVDMEFVPLNKAGLQMVPLPSPGSNPVARDNLYKIKAIDLRLTFRSKNEFFRFSSATKPRWLKGLGDRHKAFLDKYLRDSVVVTIYTRNIGEGI